MWIHMHKALKIVTSSKQAPGKCFPLLFNGAAQSLTYTEEKELLQSNSFKNWLNLAIYSSNPHI